MGLNLRRVCFFCAFCLALGTPIIRGIIRVDGTPAAATTWTPIPANPCFRGHRNWTDDITNERSDEMLGWAGRC